MADSRRKLAPSLATSAPATSLEHRNRSILSSFEESDIIAWLHLLRSIESCIKSRPGNGHLSQEQLNALRWLSSLPSHQAEQWLEQRRAQSLGAQHERQTRRVIRASPPITLSLSRTGTAASEVTESQDYSSPEHDLIPESDQSQPISPDEAFRHPQPSSGTRYWSTAEDSLQQFTTFDGFRRHENERERYYLLFPDGVIETSARGPLCSLCLEPDPDVKHVEMHNAIRFMEDSRFYMRRSRKENFRRLLKSHNVSDEHIDRLVRKWHITDKKQAYSCGLCIKLFSSLLERTNHLAHDHYERGENKDGWNVTTVIKGLLLQSDVKEEFQDRYGIDPSSPTSHLIWTSPSAHVLRDRLETRKEDPKVLAQAAFEAANGSDAAIGYEDVTATTDQVPNETVSSPPFPLSMDDDVASSSFSTTQAGEVGSTTGRFTDQTNYIDHNWIRTETGPLPFNSWASLPGGVFPSRSLDHMTNPHPSQDIIHPHSQNPFEEQVMQERPSRSTFQRELRRDSGHATYIPNSFVTADLTNHNAAPPLQTWEQTPWLHQDNPWSVAGFAENTLVTTQEAPIAYSTLKRKHSTSTSRASSSRPFITSPGEDYPPSNHPQPNYQQ